MVPRRLSLSTRGRFLWCWSAFLLLFCWCCCCRSTTSIFAVAEEPHPHQGKNAPFSPGDPGVKLSGEALRILKSGKPYKTQIQTGAAGGRGMVVQDVRAPTSVVWDRILDFNSYDKMVPKTAESQVYGRQKLKRHQEQILVRMKIGFPMLKLQFFVDHLYDPSKNSMTWTLDYSRKSDLDGELGRSRTVKKKERPGCLANIRPNLEQRNGSSTNFKSHPTPPFRPLFPRRKIRSGTGTSCPTPTILTTGPASTTRST